MSETVFTMTGKCGDAIHQFPIVYHWARRRQRKAVLWMDEPSTKMVAPLFAAQPCVERVEFKPGVINYNMGGQPWHMDLDASEHLGRHIYHLGYRSFPQRQLTLESLSQSKVPVEVDVETLAQECPFQLPRGLSLDRLVLHGMPVCPHTRTTPAFWKFLAGIRGELEELFETIVFVGSDRDREVARRTYPDWEEFNDHGDFRLLAELLATSRCFIGCGSAPAALAQWVKIPCVRVHDPVGQLPRVIWDGLGDQQINLPELDLRTEWPRFRNRWLAVHA